MSKRTASSGDRSMATIGMPGVNHPFVTRAIPFYYYFKIVAIHQVSPAFCGILSKSGDQPQFVLEQVNRGRMSRPSRGANSSDTDFEAPASERPARYFAPPGAGLFHLKVCTSFGNASQGGKGGNLTLETIFKPGAFLDFLAPTVEFRKLETSPNRMGATWKIGSRIRRTGQSPLSDSVDGDCS